MNVNAKQKESITEKQLAEYSELIDLFLLYGSRSLTKEQTALDKARQLRREAREDSPEEKELSVDIGGHVVGVNYHSLVLDILRTWKKDAAPGVL